ncbi:MAG: AfsR/SARP family transcriptional regulator [Phycicoccus sp.]
MDRIRIFGATTVVVDGRDVSGPQLGGAKPRQVLELLALADGAPVSKDRLVEMLWGVDAPATAVATLESYVCVARKAIRADRREPSVVQTTSAGYRLDTGRIAVDLSECRALLARAESAAAPESVRCVRAVLVRSAQPLLAAQTRTAWADQERMVFAHQLASACDRAGRAALAAGDVAAALELSTRASALDSFNENAVRVRMSALVAAGHRPEALRCYLELRARLVRELGVEPSSTTTDLYVHLLTDGSADRRPELPSRGEVAGLLDLLRDTLVRVPGLDQAPVERALSRVRSHALGLL